MMGRGRINNNRVRELIKQLESETTNKLPWWKRFFKWLTQW